MSIKSTMNSKTLSEMRRELAELEGRVAGIRKEGECLVGVRLERSPAAGTASVKAQTESRYARLRSGKGKLLENGKKSQYVAIADIPQVEGAIARGRHLIRLERAISKVRAELERGQKLAEMLGLG